MANKLHHSLRCEFYLIPDISRIGLDVSCGRPDWIGLSQQKMDPVCDDYMYMGGLGLLLVGTSRCIGRHEFGLLFARCWRLFVDKTWQRSYRAGGWRLSSERIINNARSTSEQDGRSQELLRRDRPPNKTSIILSALQVPARTDTVKKTGGECSK